MSYINWFGSEPNSAGPGKESCAFFRGQFKKSGDGTWIDHSCTGGRWFFCEYRCAVECKSLPDVSSLQEEGGTGNEWQCNAAGNTCFVQGYSSYRREILANTF